MGETFYYRGTMTD